MRAILLITSILLFASWMPADAAVPQTLSYQGVLRDDLGDIVADSTYEITFWIYNVETGGIALWAETQQVPVTAGIFNVILGSVASIDLPFDQQYWLAITVEGEPQLAPRTPLASVPYAYRAAYADVGDDGDWTISGNNVSSAVSGYVGIGTSSPQDKLEVRGNLRLDQGAGNGNTLRIAEGGVLKWAFLYRPWVDGNLTILDEISAVRSMTFESGTGDVGVKTEHPETDLHVLGDTKLQGNLEVTGDVTLAPATSYFTVPASGFTATYPEDTDYVIGGGVFTTGAAHVDFIAAVNLPHGATVTSVTHHYDDSSVSDSTCRLSRRLLSGYGGDTMADVTSAGSSGAGGSTTNTTIVGAVVDNTTYSYFVSLTAIDGIVTFGVVIEYTTTGIH